MRQYLVVDQKSFYASVECVARGMDPMTTNLVVADPDRSKDTICLAVSPSMKALGVKNRCRVRDIPPNIPHIVAPPRMQLYIDCAAAIHGVFLRYVAPEDIYTYSIDESFIDVTPYLKMYGTSARELAKEIISNKSYDAPKMWVDPAVKDFYDFTKDSFKVEGYEYESFEGKIPVDI